MPSFNLDDVDFSTVLGNQEVRAAFVAALLVTNEAMTTLFGHTLRKVGPTPSGAHLPMPNLSATMAKGLDDAERAETPAGDGEMPSENLVEMTKGPEQIEITTEDLARAARDLSLPETVPGRLETLLNSPAVRKLLGRGKNRINLQMPSGNWSREGLQRLQQHKNFTTVKGFGRGSQCADLLQEVVTPKGPAHVRVLQYEATLVFLIFFARKVAEELGFDNPDVVAYNLYTLFGTPKVQELVGEGALVQGPDNGYDLYQVRELAEHPKLDSVRGFGPKSKTRKLLRRLVELKG